MAKAGGRMTSGLSVFSRKTEASRPDAMTPPPLDSVAEINHFSPGSLAPGHWIPRAPASSTRNGLLFGLLLVLVLLVPRISSSSVADYFHGNDRG